MTKAKMQLTLEVAYDLISKVHSEICQRTIINDKNHLAEDTLEILRKIIKLDKDLEEGECPIKN